MTAVRAFETQAAKCQMMSNLRASRALNPSQSPPTVSPLLMKAVLLDQTWSYLQFAYG